MGLGLNCSLLLNYELNCCDRRDQPTKIINQINWYTIYSYFPGLNKRKI